MLHISWYKPCEFIIPVKGTSNNVRQNNNKSNYRSILKTSKRILVHRGITILRTLVIYYKEMEHSFKRSVPVDLNPKVYHSSSNRAPINATVSGRAYKPWGHIMNRILGGAYELYTILSSLASGDEYDALIINTTSALAPNYVVVQGTCKIFESKLICECRSIMRTSIGHIFRDFGTRTHRYFGSNDHISGRFWKGVQFVLRDVNSLRLPKYNLLARHNGQKTKNRSKESHCSTDDGRGGERGDRDGGRSGECDCVIAAENQRRWCSGCNEGTEAVTNTTLGMGAMVKRGGGDQCGGENETRGRKRRGEGRVSAK